MKMQLIMRQDQVHHFRDHYHQQDNLEVFRKWWDLCQILEGL